MNALSTVMSALVAGIHVLANTGVDGRDKPGHDDHKSACTNSRNLFPRTSKFGN